MMMKNYGDSVEKITILIDLKDHPCRILIIAGSGSGKTNAFLKLIKHQRQDIDKSYVYVKDTFKLKYQLLINKREKLAIKKLRIPKAFIDYSQTINDFYEKFRRL